MNVLSLFDGMSCGQIALNRIGIKPRVYFASEVDRHAIKVAKKNYPNTIHIGDVREVTAEQVGEIDLLIGGSPCQSFSFAGKRKGMSTKCEEKILSLKQYLKLKSEGFEFEGQSYLFWEYVRLWQELKPKYWLLENVVMSKEWETVISRTLGIAPILIDSALVSAQTRKRLYWTNINVQPSGLFGDLQCMIPQPKDKGIVLSDILESWGDCGADFRTDEGLRIREGGESGTLCARARNDESCGRLVAQVGAMRGRYLVDGVQQDAKMRTAGLTTQEIEIRKDQKSNCLTTVQKDNLVILPDKSYCLTARYDGVTARHDIPRKQKTLIPDKNGVQEYNGIRYRKLTPVECERLQTVPDNYTEGVSNSQRYKMLGNGWTVDVIAHILKHAKFTS